MAVNRMVPDQFEFEKTLGVGAFSKVLAAKYTPDGKKYAIKLIAKRQILSASTEEERTRMAEVARREMRMLLMCEHPNIIRFFASMQTSDDLMFVTELCEGGELLDAIKRRGTIPLPAARHVAAELLSAIGYLHLGDKKTYPIVANAPLKAVTILHRDIKPENIMLTESRHIKLIDFGTAVICESIGERPKDERGGSGAVGRGRAATFCGTTHYMSPELLQHNYTCTASDYWALGCVLYYMLAGKRPFDAPTQYLLIKAILENEVDFRNTNMDPDAADLCAKLLVKNPEARLGSPEMGGPEAIRIHPFFLKHITSWDTLHLDDVRKLWQRDAVWVKDSQVAKCQSCGRDFTVTRRKHHCRNCGNIYCNDCSTRRCVIPESSYTTQERVCDSCFARLHNS